MHRQIAADAVAGAVVEIETRLPQRPPRERVVQDVEIPLERTAEFLRWFLREVPIEPIWLCPLQLRDARPWTLYPLEPGERYVNVGFWSTVPLDPAGGPGATNRRIEDAVSDVPTFTRKLRRVPLGLDHPIWVRDTRFDIERHVHRLAVPAPGGYEELTALTGHLAGLPLDRSRPLWEMWVIEGYADEDGE